MVADTRLDGVPDVPDLLVVRVKGLLHRVTFHQVLLR